MGIGQGNSASCPIVQAGSEVDGGQLPALANFGTVTFTNAQVGAAGIPWTPIRSAPHYGAEMYNGSHELAYNVGISPSSFAVHWKAAT